MSRTLLTVVLVLAAAASAVAHHDEKKGDGYVLAINEGAHISAADLDTFLALRKKIKGDFLWVRRKGQTYLIQNKEILDRALEAMRPQHALAIEFEIIHKKLRPLEAKERALDREENRLERISERRDDERSLENEMRKLEEKQRQLEREVRVVEEQERVLEKRQDKLEAEADKKIEKLIDEAFKRGLARRAQ